LGGERASGVGVLQSDVETALTNDHPHALSLLLSDCCGSIFGARTGCRCVAGLASAQQYQTEHQAKCLQQSALH
jgi:hypothetical protein